jgi:hypothetical protein
MLVLPELTLPEHVLTSFTVYRELKTATSESYYEQVSTRLQTEWTYVGGVMRLLFPLFSESAIINGSFLASR